MINTTEAYSEPSRTSKMELFAKIVNSFQRLTIFAKSAIFDIRLRSEYASEVGLRSRIPGKKTGSRIMNTTMISLCWSKLQIKVSTQPAFTCSKLTIETLEQGVKYVQS